MTDLLKCPCRVLLSLVLVVTSYGDIGTYNMIGAWAVKTVGFSMCRRINLVLTSFSIVYQFFLKCSILKLYLSCVREIK